MSNRAAGYKPERNRLRLFLVGADARNVGRSPEGILYQSKSGDVTVWVKTWGELFQECEGRMNFYKKQLEYAATQASGLAHLRATYEKYLPEVLKQVGESAVRGAANNGK